MFAIIEPLNVCNHNDRDGARDQRKSAFNLGDADKIRPLKASPSMRAFIVAIIVFGLTFGISILVLFRYGLRGKQTRPPTPAPENTPQGGTPLDAVMPRCPVLPLLLAG